MTRPWQSLAFAAILVSTTAPVSAETPAQRAYRNLELLRSGAKTLADLSDAERRELAAFEQLERDGKRADRRTPRQRCIDEEVAREGGKPSELALSAIDLKCSQR